MMEPTLKFMPETFKQARKYFKEQGHDWPTSAKDLLIDIDHFKQCRAKLVWDLDEDMSGQRP